MSARNVYIVLLLGCAIIGCKQRREKTNILYSDRIPGESVFRNLIERPEDREWYFTKIEDNASFSEESHNNISAVVLGIGDINNLNYRTAPQLKRYLESGGGGIVIVRDTIFNNPGFPWLDAWSDKG